MVRKQRSHAPRRILTAEALVVVGGLLGHGRTAWKQGLFIGGQGGFCIAGVIAQRQSQWRASSTA